MKNFTRNFKNYLYTVNSIVNDNYMENISNKFFKEMVQNKISGHCNCIDIMVTMGEFFWKI